jgi:hypothetical protein
MVSHFRPWLDAWVDSAYGEDGFWRTARPVDHFRTPSTSTPLLAGLVADLLVEHPEIGTVVELGAGDGRLLADLAALRPDLSLSGVDLRSRPAGLPGSVGWCQDLWDVRTGCWRAGAASGLLDRLAGPALVVCAEWLDDLPCPVASRVPDQPRLVEVDQEGRERLGDQLDPEEAAWAAMWSPWSQRLEIGTTRDRAWEQVCRSLRRTGGLALLVDYGHLADRRPVGGSLTAYRLGRRLHPHPSPEVNLTAAVAVDAVADAGHRAGATTLLRARQADLVAATEPPDPTAAPADPLADLVSRSHRAALASARIWGQQWWLLQSVTAQPVGARG